MCACEAASYGMRYGRRTIPIVFGRNELIANVWLCGVGIGDKNSREEKTKKSTAKKNSAALKSGRSGRRSDHARIQAESALLRAPWFLTLSASASLLLSQRERGHEAAVPITSCRPI
eukprot:6193927-Pleurochrysis_carterae.AAC.3